MVDAGQRAALLVEALVAQRSGEDWSGVRLSLSTADLVSGARLPELPSLRLSRAQPPPRRGYRPPAGGAGAAVRRLRSGVRRGAAAVRSAAGAAGVLAGAAAPAQRGGGAPAGELRAGAGRGRGHARGRGRAHGDGPRGGHRPQPDGGPRRTAAPVHREGADAIRGAAGGPPPAPAAMAASFSAAPMPEMAKRRSVGMALGGMLQQGYGGAGPRRRRQRAPRPWSPRRAGWTSTPCTWAR